jgi:hypothetical protein
MQAPLSYPKERGMRLSTVAIGDTFLNPAHAATPLLLYDALALC